MKPVSYSIAPEQLWQSILPWKFHQEGAQLGCINISLGSSPAPDTERRIIDEVGSYGRQIGRIGDALDVLLRHVRLDELTPEEADVLTVLKSQLAEVRSIKRREAMRRDRHR
jgi:hypothetical protein